MAGRVSCVESRAAPRRQWWRWPRRAARRARAIAKMMPRAIVIVICCGDGILSANPAWPGGADSDAPRQAFSRHAIMWRSAETRCDDPCLPIMVTEIAYEVSARGVNGEGEYCIDGGGNERRREDEMQ